MTMQTFERAILGEQQEYNASIMAQSVRMEDPNANDLEALRRARKFNRDGSLRYTVDPLARNGHVDTKSGPVPIRCFHSKSARGLAIHFHGGGWALGSMSAQDSQLRMISEQSMLDVVSVDYPLAPETSLPRIIDVCRATLETLAQRNDERPILLVGESAGAHLALAATLGLRDTGIDLTQIKAMALAYGIYDLAMTPSQRAWGRRFLGLSTPWLEHFYDLALPGLKREQRGSAEYSPLHADLTGLPPVLLTIGSLDPLLDDSVLLHERLLAVGNSAHIDVYPDAGHGFNHAPTAMAAHANAALWAFLSRSLAK